jgi:hypothetical protein
MGGMMAGRIKDKGRLGATATNDARLAFGSFETANAETVGIRRKIG